MIVATGTDTPVPIPTMTTMHCIPIRNPTARTVGFRVLPKPTPGAGITAQGGNGTPDSSLDAGATSVRAA